MELRSKLLKLEKSYSWSFLGFLLAIIFGGISIYLGFIHKENPELTFKIESSISALEVRENINNLKIFYNNEDIAKSNSDIIVIKLRVENSGNAPIYQALYDTNELLGFEISNGSISETPKFIDHSTKYLEENLTIERDDNNPSQFRFNPIIIEPNDYFILKIVITIQQGTLPILSPIGKIASVNRIRLTKPETESLEVGYWDSAFSGGIYNIIFRTLIFGTLFVILLSFLDITFEKVEAISSKISRKKTIRVYKDYINSTPTPLEELRFDLYLNERFLEIHCSYIIFKALIRGYDPLSEKVTLHFKETIQSSETKVLIEKTLSLLIQHNIIKMEDDKYIITEQNRMRLSQFVSFIRKHNKRYQEVINGLKIHVIETK